MLFDMRCDLTVAFTDNFQYLKETQPSKVDFEITKVKPPPGQGGSGGPGSKGHGGGFGDRGERNGGGGGYGRNGGGGGYGDRNGGRTYNMDRPSGGGGGWGNNNGGSWGKPKNAFCLPDEIDSVGGGSDEETAP